MTPLGYALLVLGALSGFVVWRRSRRLLYSALAATAVPLIVLAAVKVLFAESVIESLTQVGFESFLKTILLSTVIVGLGIVVYVNREK